MTEFVYVIGLHAVQFGNTKIGREKFRGLPNWTRPYLLIIGHPKTVCSKLN